MPKTLTKEPAFASEAPAPSVLGLELGTEYASLKSADDKAALNGYYSRAIEFQLRWEDLQEQRRQLLENGIDRTVRELRETGETLRAAADELETEAYELWAERKATAQQLLKQLTQNVADAEAAYERTLDDEQARLAAEGATYECIPCYAANPNEAMRQFRRKFLEESIPGLRARAAWNRAKQELNAVTAASEYEPVRGPGRVQCEWNRYRNNPDLELCAELSGLVQRGGPTRLAYDQKTGYLQ